MIRRHLLHQHGDTQPVVATTSNIEQEKLDRDLTNERYHNPEKQAPRGTNEVLLCLQRENLLRANGIASLC